MLLSISNLSNIPLISSSSSVQFNPHRYVKLHKPFKSDYSTTVHLKKSLHLISKTGIILPSASEKPSNSNWVDRDNEIDEDDGEGSPWEGAILYKRNASISHLEYCTTLERLGLAKVSSEVSRNRASEMGMRVLKSVKDYPNGTPVMISIEVTRKKHSLRLDGIVRSVIVLNCHRCGDPTAQSIYSDLSILLSEEPIEEETLKTLGAMFGEGNTNNFEMNEAEDGDDSDSLIDSDDQLYFPPEEKVIDISKIIRDLIHIEITDCAVCDPRCKGVCLNCGMNLNSSNCKCSNDKVEEKGYGPFKDLKKQMMSK